MLSLQMDAQCVKTGIMSRVFGFPIGGLPCNQSRQLNSRIFPLQAAWSSAIALSGSGDWFTARTTAKFAAPCARTSPRLARLFLPAANGSLPRPPAACLAVGGLEYKWGNINGDRNINGKYKWEI